MLLVQRRVLGEDNTEVEIMKIINGLPSVYLQILQIDGYSVEEIAYTYLNKYYDGTLREYSTDVYEKLSELKIPLRVHDSWYDEVLAAVGVKEQDDALFLSKADWYYAEYGEPLLSTADAACKQIIDNYEDKDVLTFLALAFEYDQRDTPEGVLCKQYKYTYGCEFPLAVERPVDFANIVRVMGAKGMAADAVLSEEAQEWLQNRINLLAKLQSNNVDVYNWRALYVIADSYLPDHVVLKSSDGLDVLTMLLHYGKDAVKLHCEKVQSRCKADSLDFLKSLGNDELYALIRQVVYSAYGRLVPTGKDDITSNSPVEYAAFLADALANNYYLMFGDTIVPLLNLLKEL